jgi:hypothetical protein
MYFKIVLENQEELKLPDAGFVCGYFVIGENDFSINIFNDGVCTIMLTLSDLLDFIAGGNKKFDWVGADNGKTVKVNIENGFIVFSGKYFRSLFQYNDFKKELLSSVDAFINSCRLLNQKIDKESGFLSLEWSYKNVNAIN